MALPEHGSAKLGNPAFDADGHFCEAHDARPSWSCFLDWDGARSAKVREAVFAAAASDMLVIGTHFVAPTASFRFDT